MNGQLSFAYYQGDQNGVFKLGSLAVLTLRGKQITELTAFLDPAVNGRFANRLLAVD